MNTISTPCLISQPEQLPLVELVVLELEERLELATPSVESPKCVIPPSVANLF